MGTSQRQLKTMLRKNWLLKIRHPFITFSEIVLPTVVMLMLIAVRTQVDTRLHPAQPYIQKEMFVEVGKVVQRDSVSFAELFSSYGFILVSLVYNVRNCSNPKIKGAIIFHDQGPELFDYSIRLNHSWAFSGFPDVQTIMDVNGPYLNDLGLGVNPVPIMQYSFTEVVVGKGVRVGLGVKLGSGDKSRLLNKSFVDNSDIVEGKEEENKTQRISPKLVDTHEGKGILSDSLPKLCYELYASILDVILFPLLWLCFKFLLQLQQVMDSFIIYASQQTASKLDTDAIESPLHSIDAPSPPKISWRQFSPSTIRLAPFPTREYTDDEFQSIVKEVMGVLYLLGFLYPVSRLISSAVFEKEQKIKEGLYMMGLKDEIFYLSWFITYALQFAISSGIITLCTMSTLFQYSDKSVVFMYFFLFGLSAIMLSFLISTFFTRAKTAVAVGTLSFLGAFFPYYTVNDQGGPMILKVIASLLSPTAFALGSVNFADYEHAHVGLRWSNIWQASSGVNFLVCLLMMLVDSILYCGIGLYLDKVLPTASGVRHPWNFLFHKCFGRKKSPSEHWASSSDIAKGAVNFPGNDVSEGVVEAISLEMKQQELDGRCIRIRNLRKEYTNKKGRCCAVKSLQLTLYENQILSLLGHNGAGKSTTISMLVGLLRPSSGDALVFGKNILTDMDEIRKVLGVCPQNDILFPELTVKEHLELFANLKGVNEASLDGVVTEMIDEVGLADKVNTVVRALSGGMKRKLSLGIALIGDSKVVILDEPTSGMDPYSMRLTWHSLFLKHQYGVGYTLTLVKNVPTASVAADIVYRHVPSATCVTEVGNEICFKLPLASSSSFENMFREIEGCMRLSDPNSGAAGDEHNHSIGIESYGISVTTLEEVFLRVAGCDFNEAEAIEKTTLVSPDSEVSDASHDYAPKNFLKNKLCGNYKFIGVIVTIMGRACGLFFATVMSFLNFLIEHFYFTFKEQLLSCCEEPLSVSYTDVVSDLLSWVSKGPCPLSAYVNEEVKFNFESLQGLLKNQFVLFGFDICKLQKYVKGRFIVIAPLYGAIVMDDRNDDGSLGYTVLHNSSGRGRASKNLECSGRVLSDPDHLGGFSIVKEREVKAKHQQLISGVCVYMVILVFNICMGLRQLLISNIFCNNSLLHLWSLEYLKLIYPASGVILFVYGLKNLVKATVSHSILELIYGNVQGMDQFIGKGSFLPTILMFLEYGLAVASSTYCLTFFFSEHTMAQNVVLLVHFFSGLILMVISFIMGMMETTAHTNSVLKNIFRLSPGFCFADGLASLALLRQGLKDGSGDGVLDWNVSGAAICYLAAEGIVYYLITLGLELVPPNKVSVLAIEKFWKSIKTLYPRTSSSYKEPLLESSSKYVDLDLDDDVDVRAERSRVLSGSIDNAIIYLRNLRKVYPGWNYHGEERPSDGTAFIFGKDISSNPKAAHCHIGYCPQFDALLEFLTVREHLEMYARIKGVPQYQLEDVSCDKPSFALSGGNKRKLSVAIAMIGDPPIVILDEPSTGMDPIAKRFMWEVISRLSTRRGKSAVILTTHSMNEAQALCTRIGIMVGGRLRCIGSPQHLKTRFGNHLELEDKDTCIFNYHSAGASGEELSEQLVRDGYEQKYLDPYFLTSPFSPANCSVVLHHHDSRWYPIAIIFEWWLAKEKFSTIDAFIQSSFPGATFQGCNGLSVKYQLPYGEDLSLADVFGHLERNRDLMGIAEYSISQSTLETIFNHFAAKS
ncbi:hypothetical protein C3L33_02162, partial [Rhododendron williamsianum]